MKYGSQNHLHLANQYPDRIRRNGCLWCVCPSDEARRMSLREPQPPAVVPVTSTQTNALNRLLTRWRSDCFRKTPSLCLPAMLHCTAVEILQHLHRSRDVQRSHMAFLKTRFGRVWAEICFKCYTRLKQNLGILFEASSCVGITDRKSQNTSFATVSQ